MKTSFAVLALLGLAQAASPIVAHAQIKEEPAAPAKPADAAAPAAPADAKPADAAAAPKEGSDAAKPADAAAAVAPKEGAKDAKADAPKEGAEAAKADAPKEGDAKAEAPKAEEKPKKDAAGEKKAAGSADGKNSASTEAAREEARNTVSTQEADEKENAGDHTKASDKANTETSKTRATNVDNYDFQRRGTAPQARDSGKYFSNSLTQKRGEPTNVPKPPADAIEKAEPAVKKELPGQGNKKEKPDTEPKKENMSKLGFDAKAAGDLTTSARIDAVKAASVTVSTQGQDERSNVKENAESVSASTKQAEDERIDGVKRFDYQRRGTSPAARDHIDWADHTKVGSLAQIREEPAAAAAPAEAEAAKPAEGTKPADAAAPADAKVEAKPADGEKPAEGVKKEAEAPKPPKEKDEIDAEKKAAGDKKKADEKEKKIVEKAKKADEKEESTAPKNAAEKNARVAKAARKAAFETVVEQEDTENDNLKTWSTRSDKDNADTLKARVDNVDNFDFQRRGAAPKARDSMQYFSNSLLMNMQDMPEYHDHSKLQTDVMFNGIPQHAVMFNKKNGALVQRHSRMSLI